MNPAVIEARKVNTRNIFREIMCNRDISRLELVSKFRLSAATVALAANDLLQRELVLEVKGADSAVGRKAKLLRLNDKRNDILFIDFGDKQVLKLRLCDMAGRIKHSGDLKLNMKVSGGNANEIVAGIIDAIIGFVEKSGEPQSKLLAATMIASGLVYHDGTIDAAFYNWERLPLPGALQSAIGVPVFADTVPRINGMYEMLFEPMGNRSVVYLSLEPGVGIAYFRDGKPLMGKNNMFGEIGHISLNEDGPLCYCGNKGCFEGYCENRLLLARFEKLLGEGGCPILTASVQANGGLLTWEIVFEAYRRGSVRTQSILAEAADYLGRGLVTIRNILDPDCIIFSGDFLTKDDYALKTALSVMRKRITIRGIGEPEMRRARLSPNELEVCTCLYTIERMMKQLI